jgi:mono/diheme cytochrome c family protein
MKTLSPCRSALSGVGVVAAIVISSWVLQDAAGQEPPRPAPEAIDFTRDIRPIFQARCQSCHGPEKQKSGFRLDDKEAALQGGDSGPAITPGKGDASPLLRRVLSTEKGERMPPTGDPLTAAQVRLLRTWIDAGAPWPSSGTATDRVSKHWSFQPVRRPPVPVIADATPARNEIDQFISARLQTARLAMSPEADRRTLIRRVSFDLLGLPPTPEDVEQFVRDPSPAAYENLVDRLLASPHFGERWARHWLDVVRFAESHGFERNQPRPNAWPYRDYVIGAFNEDKPFNQFLREQLAGDVLGADEATGFLVGGARDEVPSPDPVLTAQQRADELHDMVSTTGSAFLGLTLGCARCHNHKFDPITQADYYAVTADLAGVRHGERPPKSTDWIPSTKTIYAGQFEQPVAIHRLQRGEPTQPRETIAPGALSAFGVRFELNSDSEPARRLALAAWITNPRHPLTARVMVNRLWHYHFGEGIVSTPSDLGTNGAAPTHPDLLDWLASEFVARGWSLKAMHRLIVLSATYRQSSRADAIGLEVDAGNRLLWRFPPQRLEAEPLRDAILATCGNLNLTLGGPGFELFEANKKYVKIYTPKTQFGPPEWRRMVYECKPRMQLDSVFGVFDCPDAGQIAPKRTRSTTPLQALSLLNSTFMMQQAGLFAERLEKEVGPEPCAQARRAFRLAFGRAPAGDELKAGEALIRSEGLVVFCRALLNANEFVFVF